MSKARIRSYPNLKLWRDAQKFGQRKAAKYLGISQTAYCRLETGRRPIKGKLAKDVMEKTGVPLEVLVGVL